MANQADLAVRVKSLERRVWIVAAVGILPWLGVGTAGAIGWSRVRSMTSIALPIPIEAPEVRAVRHDGAVVARLGAAGLRLRAPLRLASEEDKEIAYFGAQGNGTANLTLRDAKGNIVLIASDAKGRGGFVQTSLDADRILAYLGAADDGKSCFQLRTPEGQRFAFAGLNQHGHGMLELTRSDGGTSVSAGAEPSGDASLGIYGANGKASVYLIAEPYGGVVRVYDPDERIAGRIGSSQGRGGAIRLNGPDGEPRIGAGVDQNGDGFLHVHGADGKRRPN